MITVTPSLWGTLFCCTKHTAPLLQTLTVLAWRWNVHTCCVLQTHLIWQVTREKLKMSEETQTTTAPTKKLKGYLTVITLSLVSFSSLIPRWRQMSPKRKSWVIGGGIVAILGGVLSWYKKRRLAGSLPAPLGKQFSFSFFSLIPRLTPVCKKVLGILQNTSNFHLMSLSALCTLNKNWRTSYDPCWKTSTTGMRK